MLGMVVMMVLLGLNQLQVLLAVQRRRRVRAMLVKGSVYRLDGAWNIPDLARGLINRNMVRMQVNVVVVCDNYV